MKKFTILSTAGALATAVFLTACSAPGQNEAIGIPSAHGFANIPSNDNERAPLLYVSVEANTARILVYRQDEKNQSPVRTISNGLSGPQGMAVTANGDLWVADFSEKVLVFTRGASTAYKVLSDPGESPDGVAVHYDGTAYVFNGSTDRGGPGSISVYKKGETLPSSILAMPGGGHPTSGAFDSAGNLYVCFTTSSGADIAEFAGGQGPAIDINATGLSRPDGIAFNNTGDALVSDADNVEVFVFQLPDPAPKSHFQAGFPASVTFSSDFKHVYILNAGPPSVDEFTYPRLKPINRIFKGLHEHDSQFDIATDPPARPR